MRVEEVEQAYKSELMRVLARYVGRKMTRAVSGEMCTRVVDALKAKAKELGHPTPPDQYLRDMAYDCIYTVFGATASPSDSGTYNSLALIGGTAP